MPTPDYTAWPTAGDVFARLAEAGAALRIRQNDSRIASLLASVPAEITQKTRRQFIADASDTSRVYDGSGTSEQEVDEMVSFTQADVFGLQPAPGYTLSNVILSWEQGLPQTRLIVGQGSLPAWATSGVLAPIAYIFPSGRQNIRVTGRFGYAESIPPDLWEAACCEIARRLIATSLFQPAGRVSLRKAGDEEERCQLDGVEALGWPDYAQTVKFYARPNGRRMRNMRNRMI